MEIVKKGVKFIFRKATIDDQTDIQSLIFEILKEYGLVPDPNGIDADLFNLETAYSGGYFGVIEGPESVIVGTYGLYKALENTCEIRKMYLKKEFRGLGLGKQMVSFLIEKAKIMGFDVLELETASPLIEAIELYKRMGFKELSSPNNTPRCDKSFSIKL